MGPVPLDFPGSPRPVFREGLRQSPEGGMPAEMPAPGKQEGKPSLPVPGEIPFSPVSSKDLAFTLGIPQDTLSSQLIAFFRYFSLPLEGEALSKLRRDILLFRAALP
ncbi:MAG: hypothetical protein LBT95_09285, partial [Treponema sp.]|nr:hypothetical protein [Treponema sp.]